MSQSRTSSRQDYFIPVLLFVLVFLLAARTPVDTDLWWHLAAGKVSWETGRPLVSDVFSFTRAGQPWINHSWLAQLLLFGLDRLGGSLALSAWVAGMAALSMGLVYSQMRGPAILRAFLVILASTVAAVVWSPRPQLFSLVAFAILGWLLYRYKWRRIDQLWIMPVLFCLWSNLHGGWALGFMLIGVFTAGEILNQLLYNSAPEVLDWRKIGRLLAWGFASVPALVINPNGIEVLKIPFQTVGVQVLQQFIQEWASPDFHELYQQPYLWLLLATLAAFGLSGRKVDGSDLLMVIWFGALGLVSRRNFGPFALAAAPVLSRYAWAAICSWRDSGWNVANLWGPGPEIVEKARKRPRWQRRLNLSLVAIFAFVAFLKLYVVSIPELVNSSIINSNPVQAVCYLVDTRASGRIFNEYNWGGYLIWTIPNLPVFVDGRTDLFGDELLGEWIQIIQAEGDWKDRLDRWKIEWILISTERPIAKTLPSAGWIKVFFDDRTILFHR